MKSRNKLALKSPMVDRCSTGVTGLDQILGCGFPQGNFYLVQGTPGVGKTTLGLQFLLTGSRMGEQALYVTLSETRKELQAVAISHGWNHARYLCLKLRTLALKQSIIVGLWGATENITDATRRVRDAGADGVVTTLLDAVSEITRLPQVKPNSIESPSGAEVLSG